MSKFTKIAFFIFIGIILFIALTGVNAGAIGIGIIISVFAFLDIVTGEFKENEKMMWIIIVLVAIITGIVGIVLKKPSEPNNFLELLFGLISSILALSYFLFGRKKRLR